MNRGENCAAAMVSYLMSAGAEPSAGALRLRRFTVGHLQDPRKVASPHNLRAMKRRERRAPAATPRARPAGRNTCVASATAAVPSKPRRSQDGLRTSGKIRGHDDNEFHTRSAPVPGRSNVEWPVGWVDSSRSRLWTSLRPRTGALRIAPNSLTTVVVHPTVSSGTITAR